MKTVFQRKSEWGIKSRMRAFLLLFLFSVSPAIAMDYHVGDGQLYPTIDSVPFESLKPGDNVLIHWRAEPFRSKILLSQSGTYDQPIRIMGVPGPNGEKPIIDGQNAVSRKIQPSYQPLEDYGLILITRRSGQAYGAKIRYVEVNGLDVRNARPGNSYVASDGTNRSYINSAAGIYFIYGENITIKNCDIHLNGNGVFSKSYGDEGGQTRNVLLDGNHLFDNGVIGSDKQHNSYIEAINVTYQNNRYDPLIKGSLGVALKDRSAGTLIRYNVIKGGTRLLDLVDAEDGYPMIGNDPSYRTTVAYGNVLLDETSDPVGRLVHYGGDSGVTADYRKGELYFEQNTVVIRKSQSGANGIWRTILFEASTNDETIEARNNIVYVASDTPGIAPTRFSLMLSDGSLLLGNNFISPKSYDWRDCITPVGSISGEQTDLTNLENDPGFVNPLSDYRLKTGSICIGAATNRLSDYMKTLGDISPYALQQDTQGGADLGAYRTTAYSGAPSSSQNTSGTGTPTTATDVPELVSISLNQSVVTSFVSPFLTINISSAPKTYITAQVTSSDPAVASAPATRNIWAPLTSYSFQIATLGVKVPTPVTLTVSFNGVSKSVTLTVIPK